MNQVNWNGRLLPQDSTLFSATNRAFQYGDSLFETIRIFNGRIPFLPFHFERLDEGMDVMGMCPPPKWSLGWMRDEIRKLVSESGNWRIRFTMFRNDGGRYTPVDSNVQFLVVASPLETSLFSLNKKGLEVGVSEHQLLFHSPYSHLKKGSATAYIHAALERKRNDWDDIILRNQKGELAEGLSANLFLIKNGIFYTPPLSAGCVAGTLRKYILSSNQWEVLERPILPEDLIDFEAAFLTNAIQGVRWVATMDDQPFELLPEIMDMVHFLNERITTTNSK